MNSTEGGDVTGFGRGLAENVHELRVLDEIGSVARFALLLMGNGLEPLVQAHVQHLDGVSGFERQLDGEVVHADLVCLGRVALEDEIHLHGDGALLDRDIEGVKCRQIVHALRVTCSSNGNLLAVGALDLVANLAIQHIRDEAVIVVHIVTPPLLRSIPHLVEYGRHVLLASLVVLRSDVAVHLLPFGVLAV